jgi:hypothetical protein
MKNNMGNLDRIFRVAIALALIVLYFANFISGLIAGIVLSFSGLLILTSLISLCPFYIPFGISTQIKHAFPWFVIYL